MNDDTKNIVAAMAKAWAKLPTIHKDRQNPHFKSDYATLDGIIQTVRPILREHGLWFSQIGVPSGDGASVQTRLFHESGESLDLGTVCIPVDKRNAQGYGSALTYARRYAIMSALGLAAGDDDDGNAASVSPPETIEAVKARIAQQIRGLGFKEAGDIKAVFVKARERVNASDDIDGVRRVEGFLADIGQDEIMDMLNDEVTK